jgi:NMD protein affecting ribosome stability and mRNA decay
MRSAFMKWRCDCGSHPKLSRVAVLCGTEYVAQAAAVLLTCMQLWFVGHESLMIS